ncbi:AAA family ATPase [Micromonospora sp. NPDC047707]|uniref:ATP-binding protein n=1 Tax=Micromonospora sp. NPDC047707 TaxID=3154498 RepID=UPI00345323C7
MFEAPSVPFVGRADALRVLEGAYAAVRDERRQGTVLISGEAGIGKTRLLQEFCARRHDALVLVGKCLEAGDEALPYAPFVGVLRQAARRFGVDKILERLPAGTAGDLALLSHEFGAVATDGDGSRIRLFAAVVGCVEALAVDRPVVLVIEDAHWADGATWDLLRFVLRTLDEAAVLTLVTHRDLPYGHPARPRLVEVRRSETVAALELARFTDFEVAEQASAILGRRLEGPALRELAIRSGGVPLFVQALLAEPNRTSGTMRDLLLVPVERLSARAQQAVRLAAVAGPAISHSYLVLADQGDEADLEEALREAVHAGVLVPTGDGYAFRHVLVRDAVYEALLPGERVRLHRRLGQAAEDLGEVGSPAEAARHWHAAGDLPRAVTATWQAVESARATYAHAAQLRLLERLLEMWPRVPDAEDRIGKTRAELLRDAVEAAHESGEPEHGLRLADEALAVARAAGMPVVAARVLERRARILRHLGLPGPGDDLRAALDLVPAQPPTALRARLVAYLAQRYYVERDLQRARDLAEQALAAASQVGDPYAEAHAMTTLASMDGEEGRVDAARDSFRSAREVSRRIAVPMLAVRADIEEVDLLTIRGHYVDAIDLAQRGLRRAAEAGLARTLGVRVATPLVESMLAVGRWDEALEVLGHAEELAPPAGYFAALLGLRGQILVRRGDVDGAEAVARQARDLVPNGYDTPWEQYLQTLLWAEVSLARNRPAEAVAAVLEALDAHRADLEPRYAWAVLHASARALHRAGPHLDTTGEARQKLAATAEGLPARTPWEEAYRASFGAEMATAAARGEAVEHALSAWEKTGLPHPTAAALLEAAEVAAAAGDRALAAARLARAIQLATTMTARPLLEECHSLARRARIEMPRQESAGSVTGQSANPFGMTQREMEVLELVTQGRTNRQIATELFISVKTASVHVSRIIMKLGVTNRGEAAALAYRMRLFEARPQPSRQ